MNSDEYAGLLTQGCIILRPSVRLRIERDFKPIFRGHASMILHTC